ncbi:MAG: S53 family peptidase [Ktedonobacteraceae bacterium]|nr:S53 family peptidase [Ktedonobacteraceae bacterium]
MARVQKKPLLNAIRRSAVFLFIILCAVTSMLGNRQPVQAFSLSAGKPPGLVNIYPLTDYATRAAVGAVPPCLQSSSLPLCYSPAQIRRAYGIQSLHQRGIRGAGRTIVIVDLYQNPTLWPDLQLFDRIFGLNDPWFKSIAPFGLRPFDPRNPAMLGFALEIALDMQWTHAIAPDAQLTLVLGNPANDTLQGQIDALIQATSYAVQNNLGDVISLSVGTSESCYTDAEIGAWHNVFRQARERNIGVFVAAGDTGSNAGVCDEAGNLVSNGQGVLYPASDPLVTAVGGTTLFASRTGVYQRETVWNRSQTTGGATGGGFSRIFTRPAYQDGLARTGSQRGIPDVAYVADPLTGVPIVSSFLVPGQTVILPVGGTSAGAPQWAAISVLVDQLANRRLGFLNPAIYRISSSKYYTRGFHDITSGDNTYTFISLNAEQMSIAGFAAGQGWDAASGAGSPIVGELAPLLISNARPCDGREP